MAINKWEMSERDIQTKFITPAIKKSGWDENKFLEEYTFTDGRIEVRGNTVTRGERKRADYILYYLPNYPIAIIEAKKNTLTVSAGIQQALNYASILDIPFAYSSNGDGFIEHDRINGTVRELSMDEFPTPEELWMRYKNINQISENEEKIIEQPYHYEIGGKKPRYYQRIAINKTIESIAKGQNRILLVMATGTGKTFTAFQIAHRLWKSKTKKRILYLADRNILIDQTIGNDFKPFDKQMTKIKHRDINKAYEVYFALYQGISGNEEEKNVYKQFSPEFFDLVIVDECHRGSAREDSAWREILEYFSSATQIGLTATPKETKEVSNIDYFGEPIYTYSLKQGIDDGFLAPYKVVRCMIDKDLEGFVPKAGLIDRYGTEVKQDYYTVSDYDRKIVLDPRTELVAKRITEYLKNMDRFSKTIVFCVDIDHAERMRHALINENSDLVSENDKYIMKITGDDNIGKGQLDNFSDVGSTYPVIATTSKLLTTGVDIQTCKLIVLDSDIKSMTEFKQIIGRGTRIKEDYGKQFFTILDFRGATRLFQDPDFDGEPVIIHDVPDDKPMPKDKPVKKPLIKRPPFRKAYVNDVEVEISKETVQYLGPDGNLIIESVIDYSKKNVLGKYATLSEFIAEWTNAEKKTAIIKELEQRGVFLEDIRQSVGKDMDDFDLICHIAYDMKPLTRKERACNVKKRNYFGKYSGTAKEVLEALLEKYQDGGISQLEDMEVLKLEPFNKHGMMKIIREFGGPKKYIEAVMDLEKELYV
ncbi:type I restriction enzyme R subunit [Methanococcus maripaludis]|uniref:Type I restriction enzyme R subunit n=2 Tax=Methanococcus maripaludis TaxID=39152 RepID=A0A7J9PB66_METMI|nr:DEAD/DEAH box helicase family protein [Methanococcus maripaludis]MBA2858699.1 type I restriction enzyme R subunit [Methanococcus maripaludis]